MSDKKYEVKINLSVTIPNTYDSSMVRKLDLAEIVPDDVEPVDHLRSLLSRNVGRVFGDLVLRAPKENEF